MQSQFNDKKSIKMSKLPDHDSNSDDSVHYELIQLDENDEKDQQKLAQLGPTGIEIIHTGERLESHEIPSQLGQRVAQASEVVSDSQNFNFSCSSKSSTAVLDQDQIQSQNLMGFPGAIKRPFTGNSNYLNYKNLNFKPPAHPVTTTLAGSHGHGQGHGHPISSSSRSKSTTQLAFKNYTSENRAAPSTKEVVVDTSKARAEIKKQNHKEVERRRRNKINAKIEDIIAILPKAGDLEAKNRSIPFSGETACPLFPSDHNYCSIELASASNTKNGKTVSKTEALDHIYKYIIWLQKENLSMNKSKSSGLAAGAEQSRLASSSQAQSCQVAKYKAEISHLQQELANAREDNSDIISQIQNMGIPISFDRESDSETASTVTLHQEGGHERQFAPSRVAGMPSQSDSLPPSAAPVPVFKSTYSLAGSGLSGGSNEDSESIITDSIVCLGPGDVLVQSLSPQPAKATYKVQSPRPLREASVVDDSRGESSTVVTLLDQASSLETKPGGKRRRSKEPDSLAKRMPKSFF